MNHKINPNKKGVCPISGCTLFLKNKGSIKFIGENRGQSSRT